MFLPSISLRKMYEMEGVSLSEKILKKFLLILAKQVVRIGIEAKGVKRPPPAVWEGGE